MERLVRTSPAYDYRGQTPNYGQHPLEFHFIVRDKRGALVFTITSGWYIEDMRRAQIGDHASFRDHNTSQYCLCSWHEPATVHNSVDDDPHEHCDWVEGSCQSYEPFGLTGSQLGEIFFTLLEQPMDTFWELLERHHHECRK